MNLFAKKTLIQHENRECSRHKHLMSETQFSKDYSSNIFWCHLQHSNVMSPHSIFARPSLLLFPFFFFLSPQEQHVLTDKKLKSWFIIPVLEGKDSKSDSTSVALLVESTIWRAPVTPVRTCWLGFRFNSSSSHGKRDSAFWWFCSPLAGHFLTVARDISSRFLEVMLCDLAYCPLSPISQDSKTI